MLRPGLARGRLGRIAAVEQYDFHRARPGQATSQLPRVGGRRDVATVISIDGESLAPEATRAAPITARIDDFIPTVDRYFLRVAIAAQHVLRGERYVAV